MPHIVPHVVREVRTAAWRATSDAIAAGHASIGAYPCARQAALDALDEHGVPLDALARQCAHEEALVACEVLC